MRRLADQGTAAIGVMFATGASQLGTLQALVGISDVPWSRIIGFHMGEYVSPPVESPASFRNYLRFRLTGLVAMREFFEIDGTVADMDLVCREYAHQLCSKQPKLCLLGIGENGHLASNDPGVADFYDPKDVKVVELDPVCRQQQVAEGWFQNIEEVPQQAVTMTIPALFRIPKPIASVPSRRKAEIVHRTLDEPVSAACPATLLRTLPDATIYLDGDSAAEVRAFLSTSQFAEGQRK